MIKNKLRSQYWFDNPDNPAMTALYLERYLNFGLTRKELQSGKPLIGIAQSGSDLSPCNRHFLELTKRVKTGIREAGGIPFLYLYKSCLLLFCINLFFQTISLILRCLLVLSNKEKKIFFKLIN